MIQKWFKVRKNLLPKYNFVFSHTNLKMFHGMSTPKNRAFTCEKCRDKDTTYFTSMEKEAEFTALCPDGRNKYIPSSQFASSASAWCRVRWGWYQLQIQNYVTLWSIFCGCGYFVIEDYMYVDYHWDTLFSLYSCLHSILSQSNSLLTIGCCTLDYCYQYYLIAVTIHQLHVIVHIMYVCTYIRMYIR